jgi:hypothetical protein
MKRNAEDMKADIKRIAEITRIATVNWEKIDHATAQRILNRIEAIAKGRAVLPELPSQLAAG